jgi:hypothetical protein
VKIYLKSVISLHPLKKSSKYFTFTEIINTLISESIVVPLPRELSLDETLGGQRLHNLDDFEVGDIEIGVLGKVIILRGDKGTI